MGEPSCEKSGRRSHNGAPTGSTGRPDMPFTTPAADVYHATAAVTTPAQPPAWRIHSLPPWARLKKPITSRISVISSVRKTRKTATLTRELQKSMYVLKMANASRNHASPLKSCVPSTAFATLFEIRTSVTKKPSAIQKPPYAENAVAPKTLRLGNSH